jgi:hypothetical protein
MALLFTIRIVFLGYNSVSLYLYLPLLHKNLNPCRHCYIILFVTVKFRKQLEENIAGAREREWLTVDK